MELLPENSQASRLTRRSLAVVGQLLVIGLCSFTAWGHITRNAHRVTEEVRLYAQMAPLFLVAIIGCRVLLIFRKYKPYDLKWGESFLGLMLATMLLAKGSTLGGWSAWLGLCLCFLFQIEILVRFVAGFWLDKQEPAIA